MRFLADPLIRSVHATDAETVKVTGLAPVASDLQAKDGSSRFLESGPVHTVQIRSTLRTFIEFAVALNGSIPERIYIQQKSNKDEDVPDNVRALDASEEMNDALQSFIE